ncbi:hypothetical protein V499_01705 [Pseudogymnoascus sp. VKM F-103]|nr:hypothetical protein V499_01705 [Pseudogymnoascus sp. VKM F-103]
MNLEVEYDDYEPMMCVNLDPIKENYVLVIYIYLAGATDGEIMVTKEVMEVHNYFTMAGATHGKGVVTEEGTICFQYFNPASATDGGSMTAEELRA